MLGSILSGVAGATRQYFMCPKFEHTECVARGFSWCVRTRFFLLSLLPFLSSFFGKKEERNEELYEKELLIEKIKISAIRHGGEKQNNYYKTHKGKSS